MVTRETPTKKSPKARRGTLTKKLFRDMGRSAMQFLAMRYLLEQKGKLDQKLYVLPKELDHEVALLKLRAMGFDIDTLTAEQEAYLHQA